MTTRRRRRATTREEAANTLLAQELRRHGLSAKAGRLTLKHRVRHRKIRCGHPLAPEPGWAHRRWYASSFPAARLTNQKLLVCYRLSRLSRVGCRQAELRG